MHPTRSLFIAAAILFQGALAQAQTTGTTATTPTAAATTTGTIGGTTATTDTGPIAIWRLTFQQTGDSINYRPYQGGFYIAPIEGGAGSLILTLQTGNLKQYFAYSAFGDVFVALKGSTKKMVLSATAASSVSTTALYAIGTADHEISLDSRNVKGQVFVAAKMTGYAVSADSEQDLPYAGISSNVGVAGASIMTATLDDTLTSVANNNNYAVTDEVTNLESILAKAGYTNGGLSTTTGGTTTPAVNPNISK